MHAQSKTLAKTLARSRLLVGSGAAVGGIALLAGLLSGIGAHRATANPAYGRESGRTCAFWHVRPPELNDRGRAFKSTRPWWWN